MSKNNSCKFPRERFLNPPGLHPPLLILFTELIILHIVKVRHVATAPGPLAVLDAVLGPLAMGVVKV